MFFDITQLILSFGYFALFAIIFSETGLLVGFFLPGDTVLFTAGILAAQGMLTLQAAIGVCIAASVMGDSFGYYLGWRFGKSVFTREEPHFLDDYFNRKNLERTQGFFRKYGIKTIFFARYIPVVRTIAPTLAGTAEMNYPSFLSYSVLGGCAWVLSGTLAGFFLGTLIPNSLKILNVIIIGIIVFSLLPVIVRHWRARMKKHRKRSGKNRK